MFKKLLLTISIISWSWGLYSQTYYVDASVAASGDGSSFAMAFKTLQEALDAAFTDPGAGEEIRMAGGTYYPAQDIFGGTADNREFTFFINENITIRGGIDPLTDMQDLENQHTILSGDVDLDGTLNGNAYHVIVNIGLTLAAVFDGLHIQDGNANGAASVSISGRTVFQNRGGGLYNAGEGGGLRTSPTVINCTFTNCFAQAQGGGFFGQRSDSQFFNCLFAENEAGNNGGGAMISLAQIVFNNCTFWGNTTGSRGGAIARFAGNLFLYNSVFWNNTAAAFPSDRDIQMAVNASSSNNAAVPASQWNGTSNFIPLNADPFKNSADADGPDDQFGNSDDGLLPGPCGQLIASGDNAQNSQSADLTGGTRIRGTNIDLGAYEYISPASTLFVDDAATAPGDGLSWATAFTDLQDAICAADEGNTVRVAGGTYYPSRQPQNCFDCASSRDNAFFIAKDIIIEGGYDPVSGLRDLDNQETILSGDIDQDNQLDADNSYHVVLTARLTNSAVLDGLHITQGYADGFVNMPIYVLALAFEKNQGGGLLNVGFSIAEPSSPSILNCKITQNYAVGFGGGLLNFRSRARIENCYFADNEAARGGASANRNGGVPIYRECIFEDNLATEQGGAMYNAFTSPDIYDCVFTMNEANNNLGVTTFGGAIYNFDSQPRTYNTVFDRNNSKDNGGAVGHGPFDNDPPPFPRMRNCTFFGNTARDGGALHFETGDPRVFNSLFWGNSASNLGADVYFETDGFDNSDKNAGAAGTGLDATNNFISLTVDPFRNSADPPGPDGIWRTNDDGLYPLDPAVIDAGENTQNNQPTDIVGNDRIQNSTIDVGAYENRVLDCDDFSQSQIYVNQAAMGANDGSSWDNAFLEVQDALKYACLCPGLTEIWVAQGTYYPDQGVDQTDDDRNSTFQLCNNVALYGGFIGVDAETTLGDRDFVNNATILSGDLRQDDGAFPNGNNAYTVVIGSGTDATAVLDGFTITRGNANGQSGDGPDRHGGGMYNVDGSPTIANCIFSMNDASNGAGGGMYNENSSPMVSDCTFSNNLATNIGGAGMWNDNSSPMVINCIFSENATNLSGGGMENVSNSSPVVINCLFIGNNAGSGGGGMQNRSSSPAVTNSVFSGNITSGGGGGMQNRSASPTVTNCSFSGNSAGFGGGIANSNSSNPDLDNCIAWNNRAGGLTNTISASVDNTGGSTPNISYSIVANSGGSGVGWQGGLGVDGGNNKDIDPLFVTPVDPATAPTTDGDLRLQECSQAIDMGNDGDVPSDAKDVDGDSDTGEPTPDADLNDRIANAFVDMGAYEFQGTPLASMAVCQDVVVQLDAGGNGSTTPQEIGGNSIDDCGIASLSLDAMDFSCADLGPNTVTLTLIDDFGKISECTATVTVEDVSVLELAPDAALWPPDGRYFTFTIADMIAGVNNSCNSVTLDDVRIVEVSSDEAEDEPGTQDGNTLNDIVIAADCLSVQLRRERKGQDNGRVYTVTLAVQDIQGTAVFADFIVSVPKWAWGWQSEAIDDGPVYTESSSCAGSF